MPCGPGTVQRVGTGTPDASPRFANGGDCLPGSSRANAGGNTTETRWLSWVLLVALAALAVLLTAPVRVAIG